MSLRCPGDIFATPTTGVHRHVSNLPRLFRILSTSAKFRLYEFAEGQSGYLLLRLLLLPFSLLFGDWIRDLQTMHVFMLGFQVVIVVAGGFLVWFWVLTIYPASDMASFGFLTPAFGVIFSWLILDEAISFTILGALVLISAGIVLISYRPKRPISNKNT